MKFIPELTTFLRTNGEIYTVRRFEYTTGCIITIPRLAGSYTRKFVMLVSSKEDLTPYVKNSGFSNADDWWMKITLFIPMEIRKYMYHVTKVQ